MERYSRATAFHEAGHAVVAHFHGYEVVSILVRNDEKSGRTDISHSPTLIEGATFIFASIAAQNIWDVPSNHLVGGGDLKEFLDLVADEGLSEDEHDALRLEAYERANEILHAHRAQVEAVAEGLMERGEVSGAEFLELIQGAE